MFGGGSVRVEIVWYHPDEPVVRVMFLQSEGWVFDVDYSVAEPDEIRVGRLGRVFGRGMFYGEVVEHLGRFLR